MKDNKEHRLKKRLEDLVNWLKSNVNLESRTNKENARELLFSWIANKSHQIKITTNRHNSLVKHIDRANLRQHLRDYVNDALAMKGEK